MGMSRDLRFLPDPGMLVEITCRTIQSRFLLRPGKQVNEIFVGCLAKAQELFPVTLHGAVVMSSHYHLLVSPADSEQLSSFMRHFNTNLSKEIGRLQDWRGTIFNRRYRAVPVSEEAEAQISRLRYLLSHGAKEGLVLTPAGWPGVNSVEALTAGLPLKGAWFDRTQEYVARQRGETPGPRAFATAMEVDLQPLPCWDHLGEVAVRARVKQLVTEIEQETLRMHAENGTEPSGARAARKAHPHYQPNQSKRSPAPRFHAWRRKTRRKLENAYSDFLAAYRDAAQQLREGNLAAFFPEGCFPPALPFVRVVESYAPG